jgi:glycosyltransferase involved in cell wall biosynthesis
VTALHATFVVPTFNRASFIEECLRSIESQGEGDWAIVVVDDASTDGTRDLVGALQIPNLVYLSNPTQLGASESRNRGIAAAEGGIVAFIDSDDRLHPHYLARIRETFARNPTLGLVCCDSRIIDERGEPLWGGESFQTREARRKGYALVEGVRDFEAVFSFSTSFPGTAARKDALKARGGFDGRTFPLDDVDLQLKFSAAGDPVYYLAEVLADYRTHAGSESAGAGRAVKTCAKKVECLSAWISKKPTGVGRRPLLRRLADAQWELAIATWKAGERGQAMTALGRALANAPSVALSSLQRRYLSPRA